MNRSLSLFLILVAGTASATGYTPRACGFDMNRNGVFGEVEDCQVCDAGLSSGMISGGTKDPDHDGLDEATIYVDCDRGLDGPNCGQEGTLPCRTLDQALANQNSSIICFTGTCNPNRLNPPSGGEISSYSVGNWELPKKPAIISGWDRDQDHSYPPYDTDDISVMDGMVPTPASRAFNFSNAVADYYELAHFTVRDYGRPDLITSSDLNVGFLTTSSTKYLYIHDIEAYDINAGRSDDNRCNGGSTTSAFNTFSAATLTYLTIDNTLWDGFGGFWMRGTGGSSSIAGPIRISNNSFYAKGKDGCSASGPTLFKMWYKLQDVRVYNNYVDGSSRWDPSAQGTQGLVFAQCVHNSSVHDNVFYNMWTAVHLQGSDSSTGVQCAGPSAVPVDNILITRNTIRTTIPIDESNQFSGVTGIQITDGGDELGERVGSVEISENNISCAFDCQACLMLVETYSGPPRNDTLKFIRNTCYNFASNSSGYSGNILLIHNTNNTSHRNNFQIVGNAILGSKSINLQEQPTAWAAENNCYDDQSLFTWSSGASDFLAWQAITQEDNNSMSASVCPQPYELDPKDYPYAYHWKAVDNGCSYTPGIDLSDVLGAPDGKMAYVPACQIIKLFMRWPESIDRKLVVRGDSAYNLKLLGDINGTPWAVDAGVRRGTTILDLVSSTPKNSFEVRIPGKVKQIELWNSQSGVTIDAVQVHPLPEPEIGLFAGLLLLFLLKKRNAT